MNPVPFRQQPSARALLFAMVLAATWVFDYFHQDRSAADLFAVVLDVVLLLVLTFGSILYFSQFILPVRSLHERGEIWKRLLRHMLNAHGPALFVQNGRRKESRGESLRRGPSLLWIDSASAVLTRTGRAPKRVLGPGIHFLDRDERIDTTFCLHAQTCSLGPGQNEPIFDRLLDNADDEASRRHAELQARRRTVSGLTRDGNEVIPEIRLLFRLGNSATRPSGAGSPFGYDRDAVERAARSAGITVGSDGSERKLVAWNQLPGMIAVDLWREYLAKFTLDDLLSARFDAPPDVLQPEQPALAAARDSQSYSSKVVQRPLAGLARINRYLEHSLPPAERGNTGVASVRVIGWSPNLPRMLPGRLYTGLQIIANMVRARMMQAAVPVLDECGRYLKGSILSEEFARLRERGIQVLDVALGGYRFDPSVEEQIVQQWKTSWLSNATRDRAHVERLELLAAEAGKQQALLEHAGLLARAMNSNGAENIPHALRILLRECTAELLGDERLEGNGAPELAKLSTLMKWMDLPGNESLGT